MATNDKQVAGLLPLLATDLPGCGVADKLAALERALVEFCRRSRVWRETLSVAMTDGATRAVLVWTCDGFADRVQLVSIDGAVATGWRFPYRLAADNATGAQCLDFHAAPVTGRAWTLIVQGVLMPRRGGIDVPDWIIERYGDAIADGAKAILKMHARQPYSDPAGAAVADRGFRRGISDACVAGVESERGNPA